MRWVVRVLLISPGSTNVIQMARALLESAGPFTRLIADQGYDANHLRELIAARGAQAVLPSTISRKAYDT
jgi:transposase